MSVIRKSPYKNTQGYHGPRVITAAIADNDDPVVKLVLYDAYPPEVYVVRQIVLTQNKIHHF